MIILNLVSLLAMATTSTATFSPSHNLLTLRNNVYKITYKLKISVKSIWYDYCEEKRLFNLISINLYETLNIF